MSKDVKKMVGEIRGALDRYPREQLQEILAYVFKEYVVEGSSASAVGALSMLDARTELEGISFAELVTWLQLHLDLPELALFEVAGGRVQVRAGGRTIPLEAQRAVEPPPIQSQPPPIASSVTQASAVRAVEIPLSTPQPMPPQPRTNPTPASTPQPMPPPITPTPSHQAPPSAPPNQAPAPPATPAADKDKQDEAAATGANRFSWLEVD